MDLYGELAWRGLVYDATEGVRDVLAREKVTAYIGFDPTARSLHVGSLLPMVALAHVQRHGHTPIALVGGGTGLIGDPSGKTAERQLLTTEQVETNVAGIRRQLARFLDFESPTAPAHLVDNAQWLTSLSAVEFMRDVGKHFSVNAMLAKESVKRRIEGDAGISYTEFSYALLQAYDFQVLYDRFGCSLQMGGSDQWGNITAGMDLIRRVRGGKAHGLVLPLITTASGTKFGKTEAGTIWLDEELTPPYDFYQFWLNIDDRDAVKYLKFFTFLSAAYIDALTTAAALEPEKRIAQRELAREVTRLVHGEEALRGAEANTDIRFARSLDLEQLRAVPVRDRVRLPRAWFEEGIPLQKVLVEAKLAASSSDGTRLIRQGGIRLNNETVKDARFVLSLLVPEVAAGIFKLSKGKTRPVVVELVDDDDAIFAVDRPEA
jgi:tyrosyl-tRNA synthetase